MCCFMIRYPPASLNPPLQVTGKYLPDDGWLTGRGGPQWAVAYHGTTLENVAGIVRNGFDLRKGVRFA